MAAELLEADPANGGHGIDLISYSRIATPVVASDGHIYDEAVLAQWREATQQSGQIRSAWTGELMDATVEPLLVIPSPRRQSLPRVSPTPMVNGTGTVTNMLGEVYERIDPLAGLLAELKVSPPCVFVFGNQNAGALRCVALRCVGRRGVIRCMIMTNEAHGLQIQQQQVEHKNR